MRFKNDCKRVISISIAVLMLVCVFQPVVFTEGIDGNGIEKALSVNFKKEMLNGEEILHYTGISDLSESFSILNHVTAEDVVVSADITPMNGLYGGIVVRYKSQAEHYLLRFDFKQNEIQFLKKVNNGQYQLLSRKEQSFNNSETHNIMIEAEDDEFTIYVDNVYFDSCSDSSIASGNVGFYGRASNYIISSVETESIASADIGEGSDSIMAFNLPKTFGEIKAGSTKEVFTQLNDSLPDEVAVKKPVSVYGDCEIFVSPSGNDTTGDGSIEHPYKTIEAALKRVGFYKKQGKERVVIYLREGSYPVEKTINIKKEHSGTTENPLIISSYNDEKVELVGGYSLNGSDFQPVTEERMRARLSEAAKDNVVVADLRAMGIAEYGTIRGTNAEVALYANNEKMTLARYPNSGEVVVGRVIRNCEATYLTGGKDDGNGFEIAVNDKRVLEWENTGDLWFYGSVAYEWQKNKYQIRTIDKNKKSLTTWDASVYGVRSVASNTYYYFNVFEELDSPGEWYLDRDAGKLYFYPYGNMEETKFDLSLYTQDLMALNEASNVVINGINFMVGAKSAVTMSLCENCVVQNCTIGNMGKNGVYIDRGSNCGVLGSTIYATTAASIYLTCSYADRFEYLTDFVPKRNFAQNNFIYNTAGASQESRIWSRFAVANVISHNFISHPASAGVRLGVTRDDIVEFNEICGGPNQLLDMGGVYTGGLNNMYATIRNNYIHDSSQEFTKSNVGVYMDEVGSYFNVYNNIIKNLPKGIFTHTGHQNFVSNNIVIYQKDNLTGASISDSQNHYVQDGNWQRELLRDLEATKDGGYWAAKPQFFDKNELYAKHYPTVAAFLDDIHELRSVYYAEDYERTEFEDGLRAPFDNVFEKNLVVGNHPISMTEVGQKTGTVENNYETESFEGLGFKDPQNDDFSLEENAGIYNKIEGFTDPQFERMGLVQEYGMWEELPKLTEMEAIGPKDKGITTDALESVFLKWSTSIGADYYEIVIAKDEKFENIICSDICVYPFYTAELDALDAEYFWKVKAVSTAKSMQNNELESETWSFRTLTADELAKYVTPDTYSVDLLIGEASTFSDSIVEGTEQGQYKQGAKEFLNSAIAKAEKAIKDVKTKTEVTAVYNSLKAAMNDTCEMVVPGYVYLDDFDPKSWDTTLVNGYGRFTNTDGVLSIASAGGGTAAYSAKKTGHGDILCFKMKVDSFTHWMGLYAKWDYLEAKTKYWNILKPEQFELQHVDDATIMLDIVENNSKIFKTDTWHDVVLGSIPTEKGVWNLLMIDGKEVINYLDADTPIYEEGWFSITVQSNNGSVHLKATDRVYEQLPEMPEEPSKPE